MKQTGQHVTLVTVFSLIVGMLVSSPNTTVTTDSSTNLSCELYGYLTNSIPPIIWTLDGNQLTDDSVFTITTEDGNHMIQNGGNTPRPSVRSVLTINHPRTTHEGTYVCSVDGDSRSIALQIIGELQLRYHHITYSCFAGDRIDLQVVEGRCYVIRMYILNLL